MTKILVTGAAGQLGKCFELASENFPDFEFVFLSKEALDITDPATVSAYFSKNKFNFCINTAAYTQVDKAETEQEQAFAINAEAVKHIAISCKKSNCVLIQISTDYVFDGEKKIPYLETDTTNPINVYGASKLKGEQYIQENCDSYYIIRTSWLYSQFGNNFLKTILKYADAGKALKITTEQTGTPTNANDLAEAILKIIASNIKSYGIYNFSNIGSVTWYGFALAILQQTQKLKDGILAKTNHYRTFAARPAYSVLDNSKIMTAFSIQARAWDKSLETLIKSSY